MPPRRLPLLQIRADNGGVVGPRSTWGEGPSVPPAGAPATFLYLSAPGHYQDEDEEEEEEEEKPGVLHVVAVNSEGCGRQD